MKPKLYIDLETRSPIDIKRGIGRYAPAAEIIVATWAVDDEPISVWQEGEPIPAILRPGPDRDKYLHVAHNAPFERHVLHHCWGWPLDPELWYCTMAQCFAHSYPGKLVDAARFARLAEGKMAEGADLIRLFCSPGRDGTYFDAQTHPNEWAWFIEYGKRDTQVHRQLHERVPQVNFKPGSAEWRLWCLDQRINDRGFRVDLELAARAPAVCDARKAELDKQVQELTLGAVQSATQRDKLLMWLQLYDAPITNLQKATLEQAVTHPDLCGAARTLIEVRQAVGRTSVSKYERATEMHVGGRLTHMFQYSGAGRTRRWAGRAVQPHNMPRPSPGFKYDDMLAGIKAIKLGYADLIYHDVHGLAADCLRGMIIADPDKTLAIADWSAIEGRGLAWLAGETWKLNAYAAGEDMYIRTYCEAFRCDPFEKGDPRRQTGKVMDLASGYAGGVGAYLNMSATFGVDPVELARGAYAAAGVETREKADWLWHFQKPRGRTHRLSYEVYCGLECAKLAWRDASPATTALWGALEKAAILAVENPGKVYKAGAHLAFTVRGGVLVMRLPSGGFLFYYGPEIKPEMDLVVKDGKPVLDAHGKKQYKETGRKTLWTMDPRFGRKHTLKGLLAENATQAMCRDILADALPRAEAAGYPVVTHTHDEIVAEVPLDSDLTHEGLADIMCQPISWAPGFPLAAAGFTAPRYGKDD